MHPRQELLFAASSDPGEAFAALSSRYAVEAERSTRSDWTGLDTADWRLHRAGLALRIRREGRTRELILESADGARFVAPAGTGPWPRRVDSLPESPVVERLRPVIGPRALLPLAEVEVRSIPLLLRDDEAKIRVRLRIDQQRLVSPSRLPLPLRVVVKGLRGYDRDAERAVRLLGDALPPAPNLTTAVQAALVAAGLQPGGGLGGAGDPVPLDPAAPLTHSLAVVLGLRLDVVVACRDGVLADTDPEYLHDLRVAARATRSLLEISGERLPGELAARAVREFGWVGAVTSPLRDLDVTQAMLSGHAAVDVTDLDGLDPLRELVHAQRRVALQRVRRELRSARATELERQWRRALDDLARSENLGDRTDRFAAREADRLYLRIVRHAADTGGAQTDDVHGLRVWVKQMRYLVDGFRSVYAAEPTTAVRKQLRGLQSRLGAVQDVAVYRRILAETTAGRAARDLPVPTLIAVGALGERVARAETDARLRVGRRLDEFSAPATAAAVADLAAGAHLGPDDA